MTILRTERLTLRAPEPDDAKRFCSLCNNIEIARNTSRIPHPYSLENAKTFVNDTAANFGINNVYRFAMCADSIVIGCVGVEPGNDDILELGYWIGPDYWGNGFATEAAKAAVSFAFTTIRPGKIEAGYFSDNPASGRVLAKIGFERTGEIIRAKSLARKCDAETIRMQKIASS